MITALAGVAVAPWITQRRRRRAGDCAECARLREQLQQACAVADQARRAEGTLVAAIADDLRAPLGRIAAAADAALAAALPGTARQSWSAVLGLAESVLTRVEELLEGAEAGPPTARSTPVPARSRRAPGSSRCARASARC